MNENINLKNKTFLSIDYGTVAIGLAIFNALNMPFPIAYGRILNKNHENDIVEELKKIIIDESIDILIIGLPKYLDGNESKMTLEVKNFASNLESKISIPYFFQDESLSTFEAENRMKNSPQYNFKVDPKQIDAVSATIILEDFLKINGVWNG